MLTFLIGLLLIYIGYRLEKKLPKDYYKDPKHKKEAESASSWCDDFYD